MKKPKIKRYQANQGLLTLLFLLALTPQPAWATILWVGGEPMDFPVGPGSVAMTTSGTTNAAYRSSYARGGIYGTISGAAAYSNALLPTPAGSTTTVWLSARVYIAGSTAGSGCPSTVASKVIGLVNYASTTKNGIYFGYTGCGAPYTAGIYKEAGSGSSLITGGSAATASLANGQIYKIDLQITNLGSGSGASINLYINASAGPVASVTGTNAAVSGASTLDAVAIGSYSGASSCFDNCLPRVSEIIVSDTDTRSLSLATLAPSANGDTTEWTGDCSTMSKTALNDSTTLLSATSGQRQQCTVGALPSGNFTVAAFGVSARVTKSISGIGYFSLGVKSNSTLYEPSAVSVPAAYSLVQTIMNTNPTTSAAWTTTELGSVQVNFKSADAP